MSENYENALRNDNYMPNLHMNFKNLTGIKSKTKQQMVQVTTKLCCKYSIVLCELVAKG